MKLSTTSISLLVVLGIVILTVMCVLIIRVCKQKYTRSTQIFKFSVKAAKVAPQSKHALSKNGPYIDTHFKHMTEKNPIGQTYYQRPVTIYDSNKKILTIYLDGSQPTIHMNSNTVSTNVGYKGKITITDFTYGKYNFDSIVTVDISLYNNTGRQLVGFHVHDGELNKNEGCTGFTNFGPISYFIHTTKYWDTNAQILSQKGKFPLPLKDATPRHSFSLGT